MMRIKKRAKSRRMRGTRLHGHAMKKTKGKGNRGGIGMAGSGKRGDQKKTLILKLDKKRKEKYFGKRGIARFWGKKKKLKQINLKHIQNNLQSYAKEGKDGIEVNLSGYKVLGEGQLKGKIIIKADLFSESAKKKIEESGSKIIEFKKEKLKEETPQSEENINKQDEKKEEEKKSVNKK